MDSLLPGNSTPLEKALEQTGQIVRELDVDVIRRSTIAGEADAKFLPHLAYSESADLWSDSWGDDTKRGWVDAQWNIHRKKGTFGAVDSALTSLGYGAELSEWFNYGGAPYNFRVEILIRSRPSWMLDDYRQIYRVCIQTKPVRANLEEIRGFLEDTMPEPVIAIAGFVTVTLDFEWTD